MTYEEERRREEKTEQIMKAVVEDEIGHEHVSSLLTASFITVRARNPYKKEEMSEKSIKSMERDWEEVAERIKDELDKEGIKYNVYSFGINGCVLDKVFDQ